MQENNNEVVTPEMVSQQIKDADLSSMFQNSEFEKDGTGVESNQNQDATPKADMEEGTDPTENQETPSEQNVSKPPTKAEGESDYQYNLRVQMFHTKQELDNPETTEEEKSVLRQHLKGLREGLGKDSGKSNQSTTDSLAPDNSQPFSEEESVDVLNFLKSQGFMTADEVEKKLQLVREETIKELKVRQVVEDHGKAIKDFYNVRKDIASDSSSKQVLEQFVIENYNVNENTPADKLATYLDMAANYLFPKSKTVTRESKSDILNIDGTQSPVKQESKKGLDDDLSKTLKDRGVQMSGFLY